MNWEAFLVVGLVIVVAGGVLYLLAKILLLPRSEAVQASQPKIKLTKIGWAVVVLFVVVLLGGYSIAYVAPQSIVGKFVGTSVGRGLFLVIAIVTFWVIEYALRYVGVPLLKTRDSKIDAKVGHGR